MSKTRMLTAALKRLRSMEKEFGGTFGLGLAAASGKLSQKQQEKFLRAIEIVPPNLYATTQ